MKITFYKTANMLIIICSVFCMLTESSCKKNNDVPVTPVDTTLKVNSLSTTTLHYGDTLTINGKNFSATAINNTVTIIDVAATVQSATTTQLKVIVPALGNSRGEVIVKTGSQTTSAGNITYTPDVFVAGSQNNSATALATYWKNGTPVTVSTNESALNAICVKAEDIYVAGWERINNLQLANYWKNGTKNTLGTGASAANTIAVNGSDVYAGGWEVVNGFDIPRYWTNGAGISVNVTDPVISQVVLGNGSCNGIFISGSSAYSVGSYRNSQGRFSPWETTNGIIPANTIPNNDKHCFANAVFVSGTDKYVAGNQNNPTTGLAMATIWKNGVVTNLTTGNNSVGVATAVFVVGSDVYVAGYEQENYSGAGPTYAKYWKNGAPVKLSTASSSATGISVFDNDIYVSGWESNGTTNVAKYWKNGTAVTLGNGTFQSAGNAVLVR